MYSDFDGTLLRELEHIDSTVTVLSTFNNGGLEVRDFLIFHYPEYSNSDLLTQSLRFSVQCSFYLVFMFTLCIKPGQANYDLNLGTRN